jgi:molecular chaperone HtpG
VTAGDHAVVVNENGAPWRQIFVSDKERTRALLAYGREMFNGMEFFDAILLRSEVGDVDGVAFVLPHRVHLSARRAHRVYLKNMLLSETADNLLPDWAVFVTAVVNANDLRPTASRESFYDDDKLHAARTALGGCLRNYLVNLARRDPAMLQRFVAFHHLALKSLAVADEEFFGLIIDWLPFETTQGDMTFGEYRKRHDTIRFVPTVEAFRQIARVAAAQGLCVINGGYVHEAELLSRAPLAFDGLHVEPVDPTTLAQEFDDLTREERVWADQLLTAADAALKPFRCATEARKFRPSEVPALFSTNSEGRFMRSLEQSQDVADPLWGGVLDSLGKPERSAATARLCLNFQNPLVRRLAAVTNRTVLRQAVELLYVQALLLGHHPLSAKELALMGDGLLRLIELGIDEAGGKALHS